MGASRAELLKQLDSLSESELRSWLAKELTQKRLGLVWERDIIEHDKALNKNIVLPKVGPNESYFCNDGVTGNLIIEGDNFDALRLLRATHRGKIRVIYIDPPYNTGTKDWVYNDDYVSPKDKYRHSKWLEFLFQRLSLARELLTPDGVIFISINDDNRARLELLMEEIMPGKRVGSMVWKKRRTSNASGVDYFFSTDHEHVLVYAGDDFSFLGGEKDWGKYNQWDEEAQDWWTSTQLTLGFNRYQRKNLFYPLYNPKTNIWYPCNPNRVWARSSREHGEAKSVRTEFMEDLIERDGVYFPNEDCPAFYRSTSEVLKAIEEQIAPPHLKSQDDLEFWVGKKIGYGKPRFKTFKSKVQSKTQPLSSIIAEEKGGNVIGEEPELRRVSTGLTSEGTRALRALNLSDSFPYPKPVNLIKNLLKQSSRPGDIVLDFFSGSGTTGQAVIELNKDDGGDRKFILCSSTESTKKEPDKNICRDICAARMKKVIAPPIEFNASAAQEGFAYLTLDLVEEADLDFEGTPEHAYALLSLRETGLLHQYDPNDDILVAGQGADGAALVCRRVTSTVLDRLMNWPGTSLVVYSSRPDTVRSALQEHRAVDSRPLDDAFRRAQGHLNASTEEVA